MKTTIIGSGFAGLSTAAVLAKKGYDVTVLEKNKDIGGRARCFTHSGYNFDMGPSWYWMPDIFDKFFSKFGKKSQDFYQLIKLDPGLLIFDRRLVNFELISLLFLCFFFGHGSGNRI